MYKTAIAIDSWKLKTFSAELHANGFTYKKKPGLTEGTLTLVVKTDDIQKLERVIHNCVQKCHNQTRKDVH